MNSRYDELFSIEFFHQYFGDDISFNAISAKPSADTGKILLNHGLLFKEFASGFKIAFDSNFAGQPRSREEVCNENMLLTFRLDLRDNNLYNYTGKLPESINDLVFHFWNYNIIDNSYRDGLQKAEYISAEDMNNLPFLKQLKQKAILQIADNKTSPGRELLEQGMKDELAKNEWKDKPNKDNIILLEDYFTKPFGQISIRLHSGMPQKFILKFSTLATHWQYILRSSHLQNLTQPAIIDRSGQVVFEGPEEIMLPDGRTAQAFISRDLIPLSHLPQRKFKLVDNSKPGDKQFKIIISALPDPDVHNITKISNNTNQNPGLKISTIIL